jgi:peptide/nickel transport system permease protein
MAGYFAQRIVSLGVTLVLMSIITFLLLRLIPGDPIDVMYGPLAVGPDPETRRVIERRLGLDQPVWVQYGLWVGRTLQGDLGQSYRLELPVSELIRQRLPASLLLIGSSMTLAVIVGVPLGVVAAVNRQTLLDYIITSASMTGMSVPGFALGIILILVFGVLLGWLPTFGAASPGDPLIEWIKHLALPSITLATALAGWIARFSRATVLESLGDDYVRTAFAKGLRSRAVVVRHVLRNALLPIVTLVGLQASLLVGGTIVVEVVFAWPGLGTLLSDAILGRDYPVVQAVMLWVALIVVVINLIVDALYAFLNPTVRVS